MKNLRTLLFGAIVIFVITVPFALAGTYQQVVLGRVVPEITLVSILQNTGTLTPGKTYYYASDGVSVIANTTGPTAGAKEIMIANLTTALAVRYEDWRLHVYDPNTGNYINTYYTKNSEAVTLFYDKDSRFGNGNEKELKEDESWVNISTKTSPLYQSDKIYLAIRADSFGKSEYGGTWQIPVEIKAEVVV